MFALDPPPGLSVTFSFSQPIIKTAADANSINNLCIFISLRFNCQPACAATSNHKRSVAPYAFSSVRGRRKYLGIKKRKQSTLLHANRYTSSAFQLKISYVSNSSRSITPRDFITLKSAAKIRQFYDMAKCFWLGHEKREPWMGLPFVYWVMIFSLCGLARR